MSYLKLTRETIQDNEAILKWYLVSTCNNIVFFDTGWTIAEDPKYTSAPSCIVSYTDKVKEGHIYVAACMYSSDPSTWQEPVTVDVNYA